MRVFCEPHPLNVSQAMYRVSRAIKRHAPNDIEFVTDPNTPHDLQFLHVIGSNWPEYRTSAPSFVAIHYCQSSVTSKSGRNVVESTPDRWSALWRNSSLVWTYYPQAKTTMESTADRTPVYLSPLGIDPAFYGQCDQLISERVQTQLERLTANRSVLTTGYVDGPGAEAITDVVKAALECNVVPIHLGPKQALGIYADEVTSVMSISDYELLQIYRAVDWVSGLRFIEGFEMPCIEGIPSGCIPICFRRPDLYYWLNKDRLIPYEEIPEPTDYTTEKYRLVNHLCEIFSDKSSTWQKPIEGYKPSIFSWKRIITGLWSAVLPTINH